MHSLDLRRCPRFCPLGTRSRSQTSGLRRDIVPWSVDPVLPKSDHELNCMRRREFITLIGGTAVAWPLAARAAGGYPRIGVLDINSAEYSAHNLAAFRDGLRRLGYVEGRTVDIDYRHSNGDTHRLTALAQELVQLKPDVVMAASTSPTMAVKRIAPALPIVCP